MKCLIHSLSFVSLVFLTADGVKALEVMPSNQQFLSEDRLSTGVLDRSIADSSQTIPQQSFVAANQLKLRQTNSRLQSKRLVPILKRQTYRSCAFSSIRQPETRCFQPLPN
jgi:hypothetical protein